MPSFEWDEERSAANKALHGIDFYHAQYAFFDAHRLFVRDSKHSVEEERWFCIGKVAGKILIVCFTYRGDAIRIFGAAAWRKGRKLYEEKQP
jgi:uncharacterized DUF497 family protein